MIINNVNVETDRYYDNSWEYDDQQTAYDYDLAAAQRYIARWKNGLWQFLNGNNSLALATISGLNYDYSHAQYANDQIWQDAMITYFPTGPLAAIHTTFTGIVTPIWR